MKILILFCFCATFIKMLDGQIDVNDKSLKNQRHHGDRFNKRPGINQQQGGFGNRGQNGGISAQITAAINAANVANPQVNINNNNVINTPNGANINNNNVNQIQVINVQLNKGNRGGHRGRF